MQKKKRIRNKELIKKHRKTFYEKHKEQVKEEVRIRKKEIRNWYNSYKSASKCEKCSESHFACLDFHHVDKGSKNFPIAIAVRDGYSIKRIIKEIENCIILCANCHRKLHSKIQ